MTFEITLHLVKGLTPIVLYPPDIIDIVSIGDEVDGSIVTIKYFRRVVSYTVAENINEIRRMMK